MGILTRGKDQQKSDGFPGVSQGSMIVSKTYERLLGLGLERQDVGVVLSGPSTFESVRNVRKTNIIHFRI